MGLAEPAKVLLDAAQQREEWGLEEKALPSRAPAEQKSGQTDRRRDGREALYQHGIAHIIGCTEGMLSLLDWP